MHNILGGEPSLRPKIENLSEKEYAWVAQQLQGAGRFIKIFSPNDGENCSSLAALDRAFSAWLENNENDVEVTNAVINRVGIAFGQILTDTLNLRWVIATDELGSDLAVYGYPGSDILIYPANFVAKRWERRESGFFAQSYSQIADDIRRIAPR